MDIRSNLNNKQGLYDPANEHDACGVGLVVNVHGGKSHGIVESALKILENMRHRGVEHLLVEGSQFIVQPNDPVKYAFVTFRSMWAAAAILALVKLYSSPILVALYRFRP